MSGTLYGVGVGPGEPELLTVRAAHILREAKLIAYFTRQGGTGRSRATVSALLPKGCEELPLIYPITTEIPTGDPRYTALMREFYEQSATRIAARLTANEDVVALSEGDPFLYGSFMHLYRRLSPRFPCHVIPGVTAMSGCWSEAGLPMAWGDDTLTVLPATLDAATLTQRLQQADAAVIMKLGRHLPKVRAALEANGMLARATYVEYGTMDEQLILPLAQKIDDDAPYFALVLVPGEGRAA